MVHLTDASGVVTKSYDYDAFGNLNTGETDAVMLWGDVTGDGNVNSIDFFTIRRFLLGMIDLFPAENGLKVADVNGNGSFEATDFAYMRKYLLGMIKKFPADTNSKDEDDNPFRYCAEYFDKETGTYYLRARYYNPSLGRFITEDSYAGKINDPLSLNRYTYCYNNPIMWIDPTGHSGEYSLSIYSDKNNGHSFVCITNNSDKDFTVGEITLKPGMSTTMGTYGNRSSEHGGIFYNLEATSTGKMNSFVSLTMDLKSDQLSTINDFIAKNDRWSVYNNCSSFAARLWNSVSDTSLSAGSWWNTPSGLAKSIMKQANYSSGRTFGVAESYGYSKNGKFYSVDSANGINSGSSNSVSSGYGAYLTPGSSSDSSSGYSSNSSGSSSSGSNSSSGSSIGSLPRIK